MTLQSPTHTDILQALLERVQGELNVCIPGRVEKYDASKQLADVKPLLKRNLTTEDGTDATESLPVIPNVPVVHPSGGGFFAHFPLQQGDPVLLIIADRSIDRWISQGGEVDPGFTFTHELTDAFAIPGGRAQPQKLSNPDSANLTIGKDGDTSLQIKIDGSAISLSSGSDFVALAQKVATELSKIQATLLTGTVSSAPGSVVFGSPYSPASVAASKVKAT